jgi:hypothetical protein
MQHYTTPFLTLVRTSAMLVLRGLFCRNVVLRERERERSLSVCRIERSLLHVERSLFPVGTTERWVLLRGLLCRYVRVSFAGMSGSLLPLLLVSSDIFLCTSVQPSGSCSMQQLCGKDLWLPVARPTEQSMCGIMSGIMIKTPATAAFTPVAQETSPLQPRTVPNLFTPPQLPSSPEIPVPIAERARPPSKWLWSPGGGGVGVA